MILALLYTALAAASPSSSPKLAVADVQDVSGNQAVLARGLTQIIAGELTSSGRFRVISSSEITQLLGLERQKELLGCSESGCLAELAGALGADLLLSSQLSHVGSRYRLDLRLVDTRQASIIAAAADFLPGTEDDAANGAQRLVRQLLADPHVPGQPRATPPPPELRLNTTASASPDPGQTPQAGALAETSPSAAAGRSKLVPEIVLGVAGLLAVGAACVAVATASSYSGLKDPAAQSSPAAYASAASTVRREGNTADGLALGALGVGGIGAALWFTW